MGLISAIKKGAEAVIENVPPPPQNVPSVNDIVSQGQETAGKVISTVSDAVTNIVTSAEQITPERIQQVVQVLDTVRQKTTDILGELYKDVDKRLEVVERFSIEPDKLLTALAKGMSVVATDVSKNKGDLFVSEGRIVAEFYVKLPPPANATGAYAKVELNLKSKQYLQMTGGTG